MYQTGFRWKLNDVEWSTIRLPYSVIFPKGTVLFQMSNYSHGIIQENYKMSHMKLLNQRHAFSLHLVSQYLFILFVLITVGSSKWPVGLWWCGKANGPSVSNATCHWWSDLRGRYATISRWLKTCDLTGPNVCSHPIFNFPLCSDQELLLHCLVFRYTASSCFTLVVSSPYPFLWCKFHKGFRKQMDGNFPAACFKTACYETTFKDVDVIFANKKDVVAVWLVQLHW